jgi:phage terminase large subunit
LLAFNDQSGKTLAGAVWANIQIDKDKGDGVIIANDSKMLDQSTMPKLFEINPILRRYYKQHRGVIELPNKRRIYIRSAERPESIEGFTADWAWLDEAGKYKIAVWINIQARVAIKKGQVFITTTPDALNWLYTDFYKRYLDNDHDFKIVQWKSIDNPYFGKEEYERAKRILAPAVFRMRYEGTFEKMQGLVYNITHEHYVEPFEVKFQDCIAGVDFGWVNPSAVSVIKYSNDGVFYIVDELYQEHITTEELIEKCKLLRDKYKITKFYPDPAEPDRIEEMRRAGLYVRDVKKDITAGITEIQSLFLQHKIKVFKTCKYHIDELNTYHFEELQEEKNQKEKPVPFNNHLMDCIRYALTTFSYTPTRPRIIRYKPRNKTTGY